jgi:hypothetical protein
LHRCEYDFPVRATILHVNRTTAIVIITCVLLITAVGVLTSSAYRPMSEPKLLPDPLKQKSSNTESQDSSSPIAQQIIGTWEQTNNSDKASGATWSIQFDSDGTFVQKHGTKIVIYNRGRQGATTTGLWDIVPDISKELVYDTGSFQYVHPALLSGTILKWDDFTASDYFILSVSRDDHSFSIKPVYLKNGSWMRSSVEDSYSRAPGLRSL